jgi:hypothetical protein
MHRQHNPNPKGKDGTSTNTTFLPAQLCEEDIFAYSTSEYDFHGALVDLLHRCDTTLVGNFRTLADGTSLKTLDNFVVPTNSLVRECQGGNLEVAQSYLSDVVDNDVAFLCLFDNFLVKKVLPRLQERLQSTGLHNAKAPISFFYQRPPTIRIQPGPARALVRAHNDAEYGREFLHTALLISLTYSPRMLFFDFLISLSHCLDQNGELNFWLPLTSRRKTGVDLFCELGSGVGDFHPLMLEYGEVASFHGSSRSHYVNPNRSLWSRVSMDFRVGIKGYYDPDWQMNGTTNDHNRRKVTI